RGNKGSGAAMAGGRVFLPLTCYRAIKTGSDRTSILDLATPPKIRSAASFRSPSPWLGPDAANSSYRCASGSEKGWWVHCAESNIFGAAPLDPHQRAREPRL
ncbi:hypothetical protein, partial [Mesorhizobium sp. M1374]|uniref:hypothetical protein n=1 Tax=Mesorhizobium sp. M1374 TaxID=2957091 RepID=UPI00333A8F9B